MDFKDFPIGTDDSGRRLDKVIRKFLPELPLSIIYKDLRKGLIKINNSKGKPEQKLMEQDVINIASFLLNSKATILPEEKTSIKSIELPEIIYKTQDIIIFNKPYNLLVQKSSKEDSALDDAVKSFYKTEKKDSESLSFTPGPLHRLDRHTSGLICFSWSLSGAHWFSENIQKHNIQKKYLGITQGILSECQEWKDYIQKDFKQNNSFQTVKINNQHEYNAHTIATPLSYGSYKGIPVTLVEFDIKTGKTHQIRSQSASHNLPLLGDTAYGAKKMDFDRQYFLHAFKLIIPEQNPLNLPNEITCPLLKDMKDFILKTCESDNLRL